MTFHISCEEDVIKNTIFRVYFKCRILIRRCDMGICAVHPELAEGVEHASTSSVRTAFTDSRDVHTTQKVEGTGTFKEFGIDVALWKCILPSLTSSLVGNIGMCIRRMLHVKAFLHSSQGEYVPIDTSSLVYFT